MDNLPFDSILTYLFRWTHYFSGVLWIGLLYFFNLINGVVMGKLDAETKKKVIPEIMPRTLFWFRWAAMFTFVTGWILIYLQYLMPGGMAFFGTNHGIWISLGMTLGAIMWFNVWFIIWPSQKKIITGVKTGQSVDPKIPKTAALASRANTYMSVPLLFFMGAGRFFGDQINLKSITGLIFLIVIVAIAEFIVWFAIKQSSKISTEV